MSTWDWRKAWGGACFLTDPDFRRFHAYDINDNAACAPHLGLGRSCERPNEGSDFCPACMAVVRVTPEGRPKRTYAS